jgi:ketopantoate reductase
LPADIAESSLSKARSFPFGTKTSFQRDFERIDRKDERDLFAGSMIRIAEDLGIAVPRTRELSTVLAERKPIRPGPVS